MNAKNLAIEIFEILYLKILIQFTKNFERDQKLKGVRIQVVLLYKFPTNSYVHFKRVNFATKVKVTSKP